jgi:anti-anti-sigma factor
MPDEIDIGNAAGVQAALEQALEGGATTLVVDMSRTTFCASEGLHILIRIHLQAAEAGANLRLAAPARIVRRVLELTAADQILDLYPSLEAALG